MLYRYLRRVGYNLISFCCKVSNKERVFPHMKEESILVRHEDFPIKCTSRCLA